MRRSRGICIGGFDPLSTSKTRIKPVNACGAMRYRDGLNRKATGSGIGEAAVVSGREPAAMRRICCFPYHCTTWLFNSLVAFSALSSPPFLPLLSSPTLSSGTSTVTTSTSTPSSTSPAQVPG